MAERKKKLLSALSVWALTFGCVIGWGAFVMPGTTILPSAGPLGTALTVVLLAPWAFLGFETISFEAEHIRFPMKYAFAVMASVVVTGALVYSATTWLAAAGTPRMYHDWQGYLRDLNNLDGLAKLPVFNAAQTLLGRSGVLGKADG